MAVLQVLQVPRCSPFVDGGMNYSRVSANCISRLGGPQSPCLISLFFGMRFGMCWTSLAPWTPLCYKDVLLYSQHKTRFFLITSTAYRHCCKLATLTSTLMDYFGSVPFEAMLLEACQPYCNYQPAYRWAPNRR